MAHAVPETQRPPWLSRSRERCSDHFRNFPTGLCQIMGAVRYEFFMSLMFPTILLLAQRTRPKHKNRQLLACYRSAVPRQEADA